MKDVIGTLLIFGDHAQRLFNKTTPGDVITLRIRGTTQGLNLPNRPIGSAINHYSQPLPSLSIEVEEIDP